MIARLLVVPAAGRGTRLKTTRPKALVPVGGRPMLTRLAELYAPFVDHLAVIAHPSFADDLRRWAADNDDADVLEQPAPTGMLDAILLSEPVVRKVQPDWIWITWCDQIGVLPATLQRLVAVTSGDTSPAAAFPTVVKAQPYIHFVRDTTGRITRVLHRREGDVMPQSGEGDLGLFALSRDAFLQDLAEYAHLAGRGTETGERNFLPFIPWLAARSIVTTFPCTDPRESIGVNTPEDLALIEGWLHARSCR